MEHNLSVLLPSKFRENLMRARMGTCRAERAARTWRQQRGSDPSAGCKNNCDSFLQFAPSEPGLRIPLLEWDFWACMAAHLFEPFSFFFPPFPFFFQYEFKAKGVEPLCCSERLRFIKCPREPPPQIKAFREIKEINIYFLFVLDWVSSVPSSNVLRQRDGQTSFQRELTEDGEQNSLYFSFKWLIWPHF